MINRNEWRVIGMSRSGNHAIINWLLAHLAGRVCFLNCAEPKNNPFCWPRPLGSGLPYLVNYPGFDLAREQSGELSPKDYLVYSHEDCFLGMLRRGPWEREHDTWVGASASRRDILILRDPFNLFASRRQSGIGSVSPQIALRIWKQHAREFLGLRRVLPQRRLLISYNAWVQSKDYRRRLIEELGVRFTDASFDHVADTAGGSSFDGLRRRCASRMKVLDRWRQFADDPSYWALFDAEAAELSEAAFGFLPEPFNLPQPAACG